ncbi:BgTH12-00374 [Blumeria graminis f. sp. triticale]|uniref:Bgt-51099 n=2 Tax=Blumeria graminis TaxID=34373 RepID=A0A9X9MLZ1_BLUGR|nr:BgTH12-00374 [Blumeria graminis f. sp. triticale]VDB92895.1 Bgt-51099 [Blumeria graminis f. sp. tritici]
MDASAYCPGALVPATP